VDFVFSYSFASEEASRWIGVCLGVWVGMSTLWFAKYAKRVYSIEHDVNWYESIKSKLSSDDLLNTKVEYYFAPSKTEYVEFKRDEAPFVDLLLVDGPWRAASLENHLALVKDGGIIYLDNSDADSSSGKPGEIDAATNILLKYAKAKGGKISWYTDFSPACLFVSQGLLIQLPAK
jgi:predicted O-methyltransferase YrrM